MEARELESRLVENFFDRELTRTLARALRSDPAQREVVVTEEQRRFAVLPSLDAIEADNRMTPGLHKLREVASTPIVLRPSV